ncbi:MAG: lytic transglycosylase domain-containing protein [Pseudomonadota bacterium]
MELMGCQGLAVPSEVMQHVVRVESSYNPYAIGVVGGRLVRQPRNLPEALATVRMLESRGFNFSIGLAQVNRYNLHKYGLDSYEKAFEPCANLTAGSKILAECYHRAGGDWGKSFSCYYSGNFSTGFRHGYVQKIYASLRQGREVEAEPTTPAIEVVSRASRRTVPVARHPLYAGEAPATVAQTQPPAPAGIEQAMMAAMPAPALASPAPRTRAERARDARVVPTSRVESIEPQAIPEPVAATPVAAAPQTAMPAVSANVAIARAVPAPPPAGVARAVAAEPAPAPAQSAPKRGDRGPDRAFIATDPQQQQDDAFVF